MKKQYIILFLSVVCAAFQSKAQLVGGSVFLQGRWLEIGQIGNGAFGTCTTPAGYHQHNGGAAMPSGTTLASVYDYGHNGWTVGAPVGMGDYTVPGTPFEGWEMQINGLRNQAFQGNFGLVCPGNFGAGGGSLTGSNTGYINAAGRAIGTWQGTASGGNLQIYKETRVDTLASWVVVTARFRNIGVAAIPNVYYLRTCDPDNDQSWPGGGFFTNNAIVHQNQDARHRVLVSSQGNTGPMSYMGLGTKDCRAKCFIYGAWPLSSAVDLSSIWNQTYAATYNLGATANGDIGIGLLYNLGTIAPGDSSIISYAYIFNGNTGIDSAFPDPQIKINGVPKISWAPPTPNYDTFDACLYPGLLSIPVDIMNVEDKCWSWSKWTWAPATGLATTTGAHNIITFSGLPPTITYTITGTDSSTGMFSCNQKIFYLTIHTCNGAEANNACIGDTVFLNAPGDSLGATYQWYGPAPSTTVFATTQAYTIFPATLGHAGTYTVIKTVGGLPDTSTVDVSIYRWPVVTAASNQAICAPIVNPLNLSCTTDSVCTSWTWSGPAGFASVVQNPVINPFTPALQGVYTVNVVSNKGCPGTGTVLVKPGAAPIIGPAGVCQYFSVTMTDVTPDGTWSSSNPAIASIGSTTGVVTGHTPGTVTLRYTLANGCDVTAPFTVWGKPLPPIVPEERHCQFQPAHVLSVTVTGAGYTTTWYGMGVTPPMPSLNNVSTIIPLTDTTPGTYYYHVTQTSPQGCVSDSALFPVVIVDEPDAPIAHDTGYCQNDPLVVPLWATGDSLAWYTSATATPGTGLYTAPTPSVANAGITYYYVTQEIAGCESPKAPLKVTVLVLPDFKIVSDKDWVCQFDTLQLRYDGPSTYVNPAYVWSLPIGASFVNGTMFNSQDVWVRFDTAWGKHFVNLEVSNYNGRCATKEMIEIRVIPAPNAHGYIKPNICLGDTITLALSSHSSNAHNYNWWIDNQPIRTSNTIDIITSNINSGGPYSISFKDTGLHTIRITGFTEEGCAADPRGDTVKVHNLPDPRYTYFIDTTPNKKFCVEDSVLFSARVKNYDYNYRWEPTHFFVNQNKPEAWGRVELTNSRVALTVTSPFGCKATYINTLKPEECCTVTMPNAFTPNGDGLNDRFRPIFDGYKRFHIFRVTNRWGHTVFESANSNPSWDGTYQGVKQDMGTYFYYLKYDCGGKTQETKGDVTLVR